MTIGGIPKLESLPSTALSHQTLIAKLLLSTNSIKFSIPAARGENVATSRT